MTEFGEILNSNLFKPPKQKCKKNHDVSDKSKTDLYNLNKCIFPMKYVAQSSSQRCMGDKLWH